ncbi:MAG: DUF2283 domain-containing protein [archaeon]|nr:DUF2283 domain-containing protein [archaeon]MCP8322267.1 DUF2283 domain-containing protein [archaeon]
MRVHYDPNVDILYIVIKRGPAYDSKEINEDIILELGEKNEILGIQILNVKDKIIPYISEQIAKAIKSKITS